MEYYFTAQKLAVGYDNRPLIENIDFSLKRGEILTLIGPNGAGKSTILKSIARQLSLVSGTIYLDKSDVVTMNGIKNRAGKVFHIQSAVLSRVGPELLFDRIVF